MPKRRLPLRPLAQHRNKGACSGRPNVILLCKIKRMERTAMKPLNAGLGALLFAVALPAAAYLNEWFSI